MGPRKARAVSPGRKWSRRAGRGPGQKRQGRGRKAGGLLAGSCAARASGGILTHPVMASRAVGAVPAGRPTGGYGGRLRGAWWPRFGPFAEYPRGLRPRGAAIAGRLPSVPQECDLDGSQHGRDGVRRRRPWEPWRPGPPAGLGPRSCWYFSGGPCAWWTRWPEAPWEGGGAREPSLRAWTQARAGQAPGARIPVRRCALTGRGAGQRVSCRGAGGEVASYTRSSHLSAASQWVSDAARARVLGPAPSEGPCLASRTVSEGNVRWARGRALQEPCLGRARPVGAPGGGDVPCRPLPAHVDRAAE